jgi:peptide/nickel transport system substrate-binding protein
VRRRVLTTAAALGAAAVTVAACSSGGSSTTTGTGAAGATSSASSPAAQQVVSGKSATFLLASDPGSLDPQMTSLSVTYQADLFLYDSLISFAPSGATESDLASKWSGTTTTASYTLKKGVTCSDGSPLTASTVAANINFIGNVKNASSRVGIWVPPGATATGDNATGTVTVKSPVADPFLVTDVGSAQIVCGNGMKNRGILKEGADGTGMYALTSAVPGSSYTLTLRKGYTWGPGGATSSTAGLPATVTLKVVSNMTTAANELLAGQANLGEIIGPDAQRVSSLYSHSISTPLGELWFNEKSGSPTASLAVRKALTEAVQLSQLGQVLTAGTGKPSTGLVEPALSPCKGNTIGSSLPTYDLSAAKSALGGQKLSIALYYPTSLGTGGSGAVTLLQQTWSQLGVSVSLHAITDAQIDTDIVAGQAAWNAVILPLSADSPGQLVPFLSGTTPPKGTNFAYLNNAAYTADVTKASAIAGTAGCPDWNAAETALFKNVDLVPFVNSPVAVYAKNASFQFSKDAISPSSIRMLG